MNDSTEKKFSQSREQVEARLVAMLLGEASPFEEEQLREQLKQDAGLAKFCAEIEKTLPLLKEALDVGQAGKTKTPKRRPARKHRQRVHRFFQGDPGLTKRKIMRLTSHKVLWIAVAVCAVLLVATGLLLPKLGSSKAKARLTVAMQADRAAAFSEEGEAEDGVLLEGAGQITEAGRAGDEAGRPVAADGLVPTQQLEGFANRSGDALGRRAATALAVRPSDGDSNGDRGGRRFAELAMPESPVPADGALIVDKTGVIPANRDADFEVLSRSTSDLDDSESSERVRARALSDETRAAWSEDQSLTLFTQMKLPPVPAQPAARFAMNQPGQASRMDSTKLGRVQQNGINTQPVRQFGDFSRRETLDTIPVERVEPNLPSLPDGSPVRGAIRGNGGLAYDSDVANSPVTGVLRAEGHSPRDEEASGQEDAKGYFKNSATAMSGPPVAQESKAIPKTAFGREDVRGWHDQAQDTDGAETKANGRGEEWMRNNLNAAENFFSPADQRQGAAAQWGAYRGEAGGRDGKKAKHLADTGDEPPITYPDPDVWRELTDRRKKYYATDTMTLRALGELSNERFLDGLVQGKSKSADQATEYDKSGGESGVADFLFDNPSTSSRERKKRPAIAAGGAAKEDSGMDRGDENETSKKQAGGLGLDDVPVVGPKSSGLAKTEEWTLELEDSAAVGVVDEKPLPASNRSSRVSGREATPPAAEKLDFGYLLGIPAEEQQSLKTTVTGEAKLRPEDRLEERLDEGSEKAQRLARKQVAERKPTSGSRSAKGAVQRGGQLAGAKKRAPRPTAKAPSVDRPSRLSLAKREETQKQLQLKLKEGVREPDPPAKPAPPSVVYTPRPETVTTEDNFSTFSLNVSDVSFKTTLASLQANQLPEPGDVRSEEFLNSLEYRDPMPRAGEPLAFHWERARSPFTHDRDIVRFSVRAAALGRQPGRAINLVCLLDNSGSMEREDRVRIVQQSLVVLARKLTQNDRISLITFARTPQLRIDGMPGGDREAFLKASTGWIPQGGTHIEKGLHLAYATAKKHFIPGGNNRVILLTDGAANMGNINPYQLRKAVESHRKQGIALDCFGVGWEGYNDNLLEVLARNGDGRYGFLNQPAQAVAEFEQKLLGAFQVAASDVKTQVEWNSKRVTRFRQVGYLRHQLKKEDFRNNKVDAAEISAAEAGNVLYVIQVNPAGEGPLGVVRVRYKLPFTSEYRELEWSLAYEQSVTSLEQAGPAMRLACVAATFAEWLAKNPYAQGVQLANLQGLMSGIPSIYATDSRPAQLQWMIGKARILAGN